MRRMAIGAGAAIWIGVFCGAEARGQKPPLLPEKDVAALANEVSGETAKRNLEGIARFHRQRGSKGFHEAAELVAERLRAYGLSDVAILQFPADGKIFYGTQRSRPAWDADLGTLDEIKMGEIHGCPNSPQVTRDTSTGVTKVTINDCAETTTTRVASYESEPVVLAEDSESADVRAELVDVEEGASDIDYKYVSVKGKIVLTSSAPSAVQDIAIGKYGAVGIVSYAQNQKTAWSGDDQNLIRWGHLDTFSRNKTFAFMVSLKTARDFKARMDDGDSVELHAVVKAGQHAGNYEVVTATIPGADAKLKEEEIAVSCHLDHQRPGANDNASGCSAILEVARTLQRLIDEKKLERPARTIRFIFPPEIEGTMALLNGQGRFSQPSHITENPDGSETIRLSNSFFLGPELAKRIKAVIHMDMVGGGPETKAVFHVTRGPMSLPSFVHDVAWAFADWVNEESYKFAATGQAEYPIVAPEGGKEPLRAEYSAFTLGSDHNVYEDSSFGIPAIYLNDWPDRTIHTNFDSAANIDPTKLKRAAFIGAASGYFLAGPTTHEAADRALPPASVFAEGRFLRTEIQIHRCQSLTESECARTMVGVNSYESAVLDSLSHYSAIPGSESTAGARQLVALRQALYGDFGGVTVAGTADSLLKFTRKPNPKGPLAVFGYDYFAEHAKAAGIESPKLLSYEGLWGAGEEYAYEVLNFADGKRNAQEIRDAVSAEYGPVALELVVEYLKALEKIGILEEVKK